MPLDLQKDADTIAKLLLACPTEQRGDLLALVGNYLRMRMQNYTATLFDMIADRYNRGRNAS